jgi:hypothetical protein
MQRQNYMRSTSCVHKDVAPFVAPNDEASITSFRPS